jgi:hypothetical protein
MCVQIIFIFDRHGTVLVLFACHIRVLRNVTPHTFIPMLKVLHIETIDVFLNANFHREYFHPQPQSQSRKKTSIQAVR